MATVTGTNGSDNLTGTGSADQIFGLAGNDQLAGGGGADLLDGGLGADTMTGGAGNDTYVVDDIGDAVVEAAGGGTDTVQASVDYTLGSEIERLTLLGTANLNGTGNGAANRLTGNAGNNRLDGGAGNDTLLGGAGNDTYVVDSAGDTVTELAGEGTDTVESSVTFTLGANLENLTLTGTASINGTGNALANVLVGNSGNNTLDGRGGADDMRGGAGDDTYVVNNAGDAVTELAGEGEDLVRSSVSYSLGAALESLTLTGGGAVNATGNDLNNTLTGNNAANVLDGGLGADTMSGGGGGDTYIVDNVGDLVFESAGAGADEVRASIDYTLGANLERLTLLGAANLQGTGNSVANILTGNAGNNRLDGGAGNDMMAGGAGDDTYVADAPGDDVLEAAGEGNDTVESSIIYALSGNVENLTLTGAASINGTGNALANTIVGNAGNNVLSGAAGADALIGRGGNDTYVVDDAGDTVTEDGGEGTDLVQASVSFTLSSEVENLTLTGTAAINATGNELANTLTGNSAANVIDGGLGADTMSGGGGNDTFIVDDTGDVVTGGGGTDEVRASIDYTLGAGVERLTLLGAADLHGTGNSAANVLTGNAGNNRLDGAGGSDTMAGGAGDDTYLVNVPGDIVTELAGGGNDTVESAVTYMLGADVENLTLTGTANINGTGNALANTIVGNAARNTLSGGGGADALIGGAGNDVLRGDAGADTLLGGADNDQILFDANDVLVDGGVGTDTLVVSAGVPTLDLRAATQVQGFEVVVLFSPVGWELVVDAAVVRTMSDTDTLRVDGDTTDRVVAGAGWTHVGDSGGYARYTQGGATLEVALAIDRSGIVTGSPNSAPVGAGPGPQTAVEDTAFVFSAASGNALTVSDADGDTLSVTLGVSSGVLTLAAVIGLTFTTGSGANDAVMVFSGSAADVNAALDGLVFVPAANFSGNADLALTVDDGAATDTFDVQIDVTPVNDPPVAAPMSAATPEDAALAGALPAATDADGDAVAYALQAQATSGTASVQADGSFTYVPAANFFGADAFSYSVSDGHGGSNTYAVNVTVNAVNDAPTAGAAFVSTNEDTPHNGTLPAATDAEGDAVTYSLATPAANGVAAVNADGTFSYAPSSNFHGSDDFAFSVSDGHGGSNTYAVTVTVNPVNDAPVAADAELETTEGAVLSGTLPPAADADGDAVTYGLATQAANGVAVVNADGTFTYTPNAAFSGDDSFTFAVDDGHGGANIYAATVTIHDVNHAPIAADASAGTAEDTVLNGVLPAATDADGDAVTYSLDTGAAHGVAVVDPSGAYTYTPGSNFFGDDSFAYAVGDGHGGANTYTVSLTVTPVNDAPTAASAQRSTAEDTVRNGTLPAAADVDGDTVTYSLADAANHGVATVNGDGSFSYAPNANFNGSDGFTFTVADSLGAANTYVMVIDVTPVNDAPTAADAAVSTAEGTVLAGALPAAADVEADAITYSLETQAQHGVAAVNADGTYSYTPNASFDGNDAFSFTVADGNGGINTYAVDVTVTPQNNAPTAAVQAGIVVTPVGPGTAADSASSVALADGKILVAGSTTTAAGGRDFALVRYNADGALDASFGGGNGIVSTAIGAGTTSDAGSSVVTQADGKTVVAGVTLPDRNDVAVVRYNADGSLDTSFGGGDGIVTTVVGPGTGTTFVFTGTSAALQPDGKIIVGGSALVAANTHDLAVVRYNTDGSLDTTFGGGDGIVTTHVGGLDWGTSLTRQADGKVILVGASSVAPGAADFVLVRYNVDGALDTSFGGGDGIVTTTIGPVANGDLARSVAVQADGKIVVVGNTLAPGTGLDGNDIVLARYNADGSLDTSFGGGDGIVVLDIAAKFDIGSGVKVQPDGKIVVGGAGTVGGSTDFAVLRFNADGSLDTGFGGGDGTATTPIGPGATNDISFGLALRADGKIVLAGNTTTATGGNDFALVRYNADGTLDSTFGGLGLPNVSSGAPFTWSVPATVFADADGDTLTYAITLDDGSALPAWLTFDGTTLAGTPPLGSADSRLVLTGTDLGGLSAAIPFLLEIDNAPVASSAAVSTNQGSVLNGTLPAATDADGDTVTYGLAAQAQHGVAVVNADGTYSYTPNAGFNGSDEFSFLVADANGGSNTYAVTVTVTEHNEAPAALLKAGVVVTAIGAGTNGDFANGITTQSDGKILVAGNAIAGAVGNDFALVRYNVNGALDTGFGGGDGIVTTAVGAGTTDDFGSSVATQADGKIVVAGATVPGTRDVAVVRYHADGSLDTSFGGGDGIVTTVVGSGIASGPLFIGRSVSISADGKILVGGSAQGDAGAHDFALVRYNPDGSLDPTFGGGDGIVTTNISGNSDAAVSMTRQPDGKILLAGWAPTGSPSTLDFALVRYNADGTLDASFGGGDGIVTTPVGGSTSQDQGFSVILQPDGKTVVAGTTTLSGLTDSHFALVRYNTDGTLDTSFGGGDGIVMTDIASQFASASSVQLQADGKLVVAGRVATTFFGNTDSDFALVRYNADGTLDTSFGGGDGVTIAAIATGVDSATSISLRADGKILVAGQTTTASGGTDFALARFNADGSLDTTFGGLAPPNATPGTPFSWSVPATAFTDADGDALTYAITLGDGSALPAWLAFDGATLAGTPPVGAPDLDLVLNASDPAGASAAIPFQLVVNTPPTDISLAASAAVTDIALPTNIATVFATDEGVEGLAHNASVASGAGFAISSNTLTATTALAPATTYTVVIRVTDPEGASYDETFDIITGDGGGNTLPAGGEADALLAGDDVIYGLGGHDTLFGGDGGDALYGQDGEDFLFGGAGRDQLRGGAGNDTLWGGAGNDFLVGGAGNDTFAFADGFGVDTIFDFVAGPGSGDVIDLSGVTNPDWTSFADVQANTTQVGASALIDLGDGQTISLSLVNVANLTAADFLL